MNKPIAAILLVSIFMIGCQAAPTPVPKATATRTNPGSAQTRAPTIAALPISPEPAAVTDDLQFYAAALTTPFKNDLTLTNEPTRYAMNLVFDPTALTLNGSQDVRYVNRQSVPLSEIYFRLFANYPDGGGKIVVSNLTIDGSAVTPAYEFQNTAMRVPLLKPLAPNTSVHVHLDFVVTIPRNNNLHYSDFTATDGVVTLPSVYPLIPAFDAQGWHTELPPAYGDLVYADVSLYAVRITAPSNMTVVASGVVTNKAENGNGMTTWSYIGAPMRDFDINFGDQLQRASGQVGETTVNSFYSPSDTESGKNALQVAVDALKIFSTRFGPYPYREFNVLETPTTAGGIEYPGVVSIARGLYRNSNRRDFFEFATAHEVAHQWWYGMVGDDQVNLPWVDESLAQYSTAVYNEDLRGVSAGQAIVNGFQTQYTRARDEKRDKAANLPVSAYNESDYSAIVYQKAPLFYDAIRKKMGDDAFFRFLKVYFEKYRFKIATGDDILATAESTCGCSLLGEYQQWILNQK